MAGRHNLFDRMKARKEGADKRIEDRSKRSDKQQLDLLVKRGHGHCKEAVRIRSRIEGGKGWDAKDDAAVKAILEAKNGQA